MGLSLVKNSYIYWEFIRNLRNTPEVKKGFIQQSTINVDKHEEYMKIYSNCFYICLDKEIPVGYIGVIDDDIRVAVLPSHQGHGVATYMVDEVMKLHKTAYAKVKINNKASLRLFKKCGFKEKYFILEKDET